MERTAIKNVIRGKLCRITVLTVLEILVFGLFPLLLTAQQVTPAFKIVGSPVRNYFELADKISPLSDNVPFKGIVEYDPTSPDHLYVTDVNEKNIKLIKKRYLFKGKRFNIMNLMEYMFEKKLIADGIQSIYANNELLESELLFANGVLQQQTSYYKNGNKYIMYCGDEKSLNGAFKMWYPDGRLSFSGFYKQNNKDGIFESYDPSGNLLRKGTYQDGKLISGQSVVQDFLYDSPEVHAQFNVKDSVLNEFLRTKTSHLELVKQMEPKSVKTLNLQFIIDKKGKILSCKTEKQEDPNDQDIINMVFNQEFDSFIPAMIEGAPVRSDYRQTFYLSRRGLEVFYPIALFEKDSINGSSLFKDESTPQFLGGEEGLRNFIASNIRYPVEAVEKGIDGKVLVSFDVNEDGSVSNITILKHADLLLDLEALRVVRSMPKWIPARRKGKAIKASFTTPINFVLQ